MKNLWLKSQSGETIRVAHANHFFTRLRGLLGRTSLPKNEGLLLEPCHAVHMLGMKFPIDILFLSRTNQVLAVFTHVPPGWTGCSFRGAYRVLELADGVAETAPFIPGGRLVFSHSPEIL